MFLFNNAYIPHIYIITIVCIVKQLLLQLLHILVLKLVLRIQIRVFFGCRIGSSFFLTVESGTGSFFSFRLIPTLGKRKQIVTVEMRSERDPGCYTRVRSESWSWSTSPGSATLIGTILTIYEYIYNNYQFKQWKVCYVCKKHETELKHSQFHYII